MRQIALVALGACLVAVGGCRGRGGRTIACDPGSSIVVGCTTMVGRPCTGDPALAVCDAAAMPSPASCTTTSAGALGFSDDFEGRCPAVFVTCPASGSISVNPEPLGRTTSWTCDYALELAPPSSSSETCVPGEGLVVACDSTLGTPCTGDPTLTVCDGSRLSDPEACIRDATGFLAFDDDSGDGFCPRVTTTCPASGRIAVNANPFSSGSTGWACPYAVSHGGVGP